MTPAEKFLRTMFGFNKASSPGMLGGAAGAALAMSAVKSLGNFAKGGKGGSNKQLDKGSGKDEKGNLRMADSSHRQQALFEGLADFSDEKNEKSDKRYQK